MEPNYQCSCFGFSVRVFPGRLAFKKLLGEEVSIPASKIASVKTGIFGLQQIIVETSGGEKIKMPVKLSDKKKLVEAINSIIV